MKTEFAIHTSPRGNGGSCGHHFKHISGTQRGFSETDHYESELYLHNWITSVKKTDKKFPCLFLRRRDPLRRDPGHGAAVVAEVVDAPALVLKVAATRPAELAQVEGVLVAVICDIRHVRPAAHDHAVPLGHGRRLGDAAKSFLLGDVALALSPRCLA